jgi:hypothetical protein
MSTPIMIDESTLENWKISLEPILREIIISRYASNILNDPARMTEFEKKITPLSVPFVDAKKLVDLLPKIDDTKPSLKTKLKTKLKELGKIPSDSITKPIRDLIPDDFKVLPSKNTILKDDNSTIDTATAAATAVDATTVAAAAALVAKTLTPPIKNPRPFLSALVAAAAASAAKKASEESEAEEEPEAEEDTDCTYKNIKTEDDLKKSPHAINVGDDYYNLDAKKETYIGYKNRLGFENAFQLRELTKDELTPVQSEYLIRTYLFEGHTLDQAPTKPREIDSKPCDKEALIKILKHRRTIIKKSKQFTELNTLIFINLQRIYLKIGIMLGYLEQTTKKGSECQTDLDAHKAMSNEEINKLLMGIASYLLNPALLKENPLLCPWLTQTIALKEQFTMPQIMKILKKLDVSKEAIPDQQKALQDIFDTMRIKALVPVETPKPAQVGGSEDAWFPKAMKPVLQTFRTLYNPVYSFVKKSMHHTVPPTSSLLALLHICNEVLQGSKPFGIYRIQKLDPLLVTFLKGQMSSKKRGTPSITADQLFSSPDTTRIGEKRVHLQFFVVNTSIHVAEPSDARTILFPTDTVLLTYAPFSNDAHVSPQEQDLDEIPMALYNIDYSRTQPDSAFIYSHVPYLESSTFTNVFQVEPQCVYTVGQLLLSIVIAYQRDHSKKKQSEPTK